MLDVQLFGLDAGMHHLTSVALHTLSSVLLLAFLLWTTGRPGPSAFVAMVFALHPLRVESVAWVSERKDVLSTCLQRAPHARAFRARGRRLSRGPALAPEMAGASLWSGRRPRRARGPGRSGARVPRDARARAGPGRGPRRPRVAAPVPRRGGETAASLRAANRRQPDSALIAAALAWLLATTGDSRLRDGREAIPLAERARAGGDISRVLDILAAAHAEAGHSTEAPAWARQAAARARAEGDETFAAGAEERARGYEAGRPLRVAP